MRPIARFVVLCFALLATPALFAQGCALCGSTAASAPAAQQRQLRRGILVLLVPTMGILGVFGVVVYRNRR